MRAVAALLLALVAACSGPAAPAKPVPPPEPAPVVAAAPAGAPIDGEPLVIDAGAEPRYQLRYRAPAGTLRTTTMELDLSMEMPGLVPHTVLPTKVYAASLDIIEVTDDGSFTTRTMLDSPETVGELRFLTSFDARGKKLDERLETGGDAARSVLAVQGRDTNNDGMPRLPEQAVGKGGRWRATTHTISNGVELDNECEFEVVDVTATTMHLRSTVRVTAPRQTAEIAQASMIVEGSGTSATDLTLDLTTLIGDLTVRLDLALTLVLEDGPRQLTLGGDYTARWR